MWNKLKILILGGVILGGAYYAIKVLPNSAKNPSSKNNPKASIYDNIDSGFNESFFNAGRAAYDAKKKEEDKEEQKNLFPISPNIDFNKIKREATNEMRSTLDDYNKKLAKYEKSLSETQKKVFSLEKVNKSLEKEALLRQEKYDLFLKERTHNFHIEEIGVNNGEEDLSDNIAEPIEGVEEFEATLPINLNRVLTANKIIPAVIITPINSEISSNVTAVVEENVLGYHGNKILIPRGSQLVGSFSKLEKAGARRMGVVWHRILTPKGINILFNGNAHDKAGFSGVVTKRDTRAKDRYGAAFLVSIINTIAQLSIEAQNATQSAAAASFAREAGTLTATIIKNNLDLTPIITITQGERFNIVLTGDIRFKEPKDNTIKTDFINNL